MYDKILVPIDGSPTSDRALAEAVRLGRLCGARLRLLHVVDPLSHITGFEPPALYMRDIHPAMLEAARKLLEKAWEQGRAEQRAGARGEATEETPEDAPEEAPGGAGPAAHEIETTLVESSERVSEVILDEARSWGARLIVLGTHGRRGVDRVLVGSDAEQVARRSPVPVLLVRLA